MDLITRQSASILNAYYYYDDKNMFPNPGGWMDQPVKLLKAFNVISAERRKIEREEEKTK